MLGTTAHGDRLDRLENDEQVECDRHVLDVEQVVLQLLQRIVDTRRRSSGGPAPNRSARPHDMALAVERNLRGSGSSTNSGRSGRGPTKLMSPISTFQSCGTSSSRVRRSKPTDGRDARISCAATRPRLSWTPHPRASIETCES